MNRVTPLAHTPAIRLERFEHEPGVAHHDPERERAATHAISFVDGGSFRVRIGERWSEVGPRTIFAVEPGIEFRCAHDDEQPTDRCLSVRYSEAAIESLRATGAAFAAAPISALTNRRAWLRRGIEANGAGDPARTEALAGALWWTLSDTAAPAPLYRAGQLDWYGARVARAREKMRAEYAEPLSLSTLASDAGMSLYRFARVFRELEGVAPHQFLVEVRLREARRRLEAGASVTETCYAVGFGSLSHFVTSFRRRFGVRPGHLLPRRRSRHRQASLEKVIGTL